MNNKKIDLTELLEGKEGIELWSPLVGKCTLRSCKRDKNDPYPINIGWFNQNDTYCLRSFTHEGYYSLLKQGCCMIYPSEEAYRSGTGWDGFKRSKKLVIFNADDYKPMHHWVRSNLNREKEALIRDLVKTTIYLSSFDGAHYQNSATGEVTYGKIKKMKNGIMTEFIPEFKEVWR